MITGFPIELDKTSFVKNVMSTEIDSNYLEIAVKQLNEIENKHNIFILVDPNLDSVLPAGSYRITSQGFSYKNIVDSFMSFELFEKNFELVDHDIEIENLYAFITETQLILQGIDFTDDHFLLCEGVIHAWSSRAWGQVLADWANCLDWGPHFNKKGDKLSWKYTDFYINMDDYIFKDYYIWKDSLRKVVRKKCDLLLDGKSENV